MAKSMSEGERQQALEAYNPKKHLIKIRSRDGKEHDYLPAAWRLYELNLRYPNANFKSDIIHLYPEIDMVVVKAWLYLGSDYGASEKKAEAMKSGKLSQLDRVETAAKARAARDFGIGTEYALDMSDVDTAPPMPAAKALSLGQVKNLVRKAGLAKDTETWQAYVVSVLGSFVERPTEEQLALLAKTSEEMSA